MQGKTIIASAWAKNPLTWIVAEVENQQVNHKFFPFKSVIELSDDSTRFDAISKLCALYPRICLLVVTSGPVFYPREVHWFHGGELLFHQKFLCGGERTPSRWDFPGKEGGDGVWSLSKPGMFTHPLFLQTGGRALNFRQINLNQMPSLWYLDF